MSDLTTKYRPKTFAEVIGQTPVINSLYDLIANNTHKAIIFHGPSGVGKSTLARITANSLGCEDIREINCAKFSGKEDMNELTDIIEYKSFGGGNRAFILDEVDAISAAAWKNLKKPLEEPPNGVYWFLCTAEPKRIPNQILTRCASFQLNPVKISDIYTLLQRVVGSEKFETNTQVLGLISENCNGSPRQALSLLSQVYNLGVVDATEIITGFSEGQSKEIRDLCYGLSKFSLDYVGVVDILKKLESCNAESVRRVILAYFEKIALDVKSVKNSGHVFRVLELFSCPFDYNAKYWPLLLTFATLFGDAK
jgi:DNA polymerase-3 subunit gamma/tau